MSQIVPVRRPCCFIAFLGWSLKCRPDTPAQQAIAGTTTAVIFVRCCTSSSAAAAAAAAAGVSVVVCFPYFLADRTLHTMSTPNGLCSKLLLLLLLCVNSTGIGV